MDIVIDGKEKLNLDELNNIIGKGQDGCLYLYKDTIIKVCTSQYMTYEKLDDFNKLKLKLDEKGIDIFDSHIIIPDKKVEKVGSKIKRLKVTPIFGYTQQYVKEKKHEISLLKTSLFIDEVERIHESIHAIFSRNNIAIMDTNPHNLLVTPNQEIYLIDHDRNITPSCMNTEKAAVKDNDYYRHNERRFAKLINSALLLQAFNHVENRDSNIRLVLQTMHEEELKAYSVYQLYSMLKDYDYVYEYGDDKAKELGIKK